MKEKHEYIVDLYQDELDKQQLKEKKKIEKFKKKEEKKKRKEERKLEKLEDKEFAKRQKMSREAKYNYSNEQPTSKINLSNIYKLSLIATLFFTLCYLLYSLIKQQIYIFNSILFTSITLGFILTSTIQKKKERKIASIVTSILLILWMILHL